MAQILGDLLRNLLHRIVYGHLLTFLRRFRIYALYSRRPQVKKIYPGLLNKGSAEILCIFASYSVKNQVAEYVQFYLKKLRESGCDIVFVTTSDEIAAHDLAALQKLCICVMHRKNRGYDFASWKAGLLYSNINWKSYRKILFANDSCYAPLYPLQRILRKYDQGIVSITDSLEKAPHLMSYFLLCHQDVISHPSFERFWRDVRSLPACLKVLIVELYEIGFSRYFREQGFKLRAVYPIEELGRELKLTKVELRQINPTHRLWRYLVENKKCPVLKVDLFKRYFKHKYDNAWRSVIAATDYDINLILAHQTRIPRAGEVMPTTHLHQIYYLPSQLSLLDPAFTPYDNTANENREFAEYHVFEKEYHAGKISDEGITGYFSWKFGQKTCLPGSRFVEFIEKNPGYDVYFINPFPIQVKFFRNLWQQGEFYHPGITELSEQILRLAGYEIDLHNAVHDSRTALYCNYWAGTRSFWDRYMAFTQPIVEVLRTGLSRELRKKIHSIADFGNNFSFIAFIIERLFTTFLHYDKNIRYLAYRYSYSEMLQRKYGHLGALLYKTFPDNSRFLGRIYTTLRRSHLDPNNRRTPSAA